MERKDSEWKRWTTVTGCKKAWIEISLQKIFPNACTVYYPKFQNLLLCVIISDKIDRKTLSLCTVFLLLNEICSERECNKILHKLTSNVTAIESFLQKFKTIDSIRHKLYKVMETGALHSGFKKEIFICQKNVTSTLYCRDSLTVSREHAAQCSSHQFLHSWETTE